MTALCDYSDLPPNQCAHCRGHVPPRSVPLSTPPPGWYRARLPGQCASCGEPYTSGTHITYDPDSARWIAECCAVEDDGGES